MANSSDGHIGEWMTNAFLGSVGLYCLGRSTVATVRISNTQCVRGVGMREVFDKDAPKKATNLSINSSGTLERALEEEVKQNRREKWREDNTQAIEHCNQLADSGLFSGKHRGFW